MTTDADARRAPVPDPESAPFWSALAEHRLLLQRCVDCARHRFPPMPACPWCGSRETVVTPSTGTGAVYSWVTVHRPFDPAFSADVPYVVAAVELAERCRVFARLDVAPESVEIGLPVEATFAEHDDWTELRFAAVRS
jgi:uncharacterized OB-fold protein